MKRAKIYIVILMIVCTGLGTAIGIAVEKRYTSRNLPRIVRSYLVKHQGAARLSGRKSGRVPGKMLRARMDNILKRVDRELDLSSPQKDKIKAVLEDTKQEIEQARDEFRTRVLQAREKGTAGIAAVLSPQQEKKFQRLLAGRKEKRGKNQNRLPRRGGERGKDDRNKK